MEGARVSYCASVLFNVSARCTRAGTRQHSRKGRVTGHGETSGSRSVRPGRNVRGRDRTMMQQTWWVGDVSYESECSFSSRGAKRGVQRGGRAGNRIGAAILLTLRAEHVKQPSCRAQGLSHENEYSLSSRSARRGVQKDRRAGDRIGAAMLLSGEVAHRGLRLAVARPSGGAKEGARTPGPVRSG